MAPRLVLEHFSSLELTELEIIAPKVQCSDIIRTQTSLLKLTIDISNPNFPTSLEPYIGVIPSFTKLKSMKLRGSSDESMYNQLKPILSNLESLKLENYYHRPPALTSSQFVSIVSMCSREAMKDLELNSGNSEHSPEMFALLQEFKNLLHITISVGRNVAIPALLVDALCALPNLKSIKLVEMEPTKNRPRINLGVLKPLAMCPIIPQITLIQQNDGYRNVRLYGNHLKAVILRSLTEWTKSDQELSKKCQNEISKSK
jgi:hypothetical protein